MVFSTDIKSSLPINEFTAEKTSPAGSVKNEISADDDNSSFHSTVSRMDQSNENESHKSCSDGSAGANQISEDETHMTSEGKLLFNSKFMYTLMSLLNCF